MEYVNKRICKKCLLQDIAPEEYLKSMKSYLDRLARAYIRSGSAFAWNVITWQRESVKSAAALLNIVLQLSSVAVRRYILNGN